MKAGSRCGLLLELGGTPVHRPVGGDCILPSKERAAARRCGVALRIESSALGTSGAAGAVDVAVASF